MGRNYPKALTHFRNWNLIWETVESLSQLQSKEVMWWKYSRNVICAPEWGRLVWRAMKSKEALCLWTRGQTWAGPWRVREGWCELMTDTMKKGSLEPRVMSRPGVLEGEAHPIGREALEKEWAQGSLYLAFWMSSQITRNVWSWRWIMFSSTCRS